jgi:hypothetical protein
MDDKSLQAAYDAPSVRVLVTVVDQHGRPLPISRWRSSRQVLDGKPPDWAKSSKRSVMDTGLRDAWVFEKGKTKAIAVPHEWGVEFVFPVLAGLAVEGIVGLTTWAWRRWHKQSGKSTDEAPMVRIQVVRSKDRSGRPRVTQTVEISGAISSQDVSRHVKAALRLQARQS